MAPQIIVDNEFATLLYYPDDKIVHHQFHKPISGQAFRDIMMAGADAFVANGCKKYLSDDRGNASVSEEDLAWADIHYRPKIINAGWRYWALVMPQSVIGQRDMQQVIDIFMRIGVLVQLFSDPDQALAWLKGRPAF